MFKRKIVLTVLSVLTAGSVMYAADKEAAQPFEGELAPFMGEPKLEEQQVFKGGRFPNVTVAVDGTILAFWDGYLAGVN